MAESKQPEKKLNDKTPSDKAPSDKAPSDKKLKLTDDPPRRWTRDQKVEHFMPMAHREANTRAAWLREHPGLGLDPDDILSVAAMAIIKAVDTFDAGKGVKMSTWVISKIRGGVLEAVRDSRHEPRSMTDKGEFVNWTLFSTPTKAISDTDPSTVGDAMESRLADPAADVVSQVIMKEDSARLASLIARLPPRERYVVTTKMENHWMTDREIGELMGVSSARAYQLLQGALERLKTMMRDDLLRERAQYARAVSAASA